MKPAYLSIPANRNIYSAYSTLRDLVAYSATDGATRVDNTRRNLPFPSERMSQSESHSVWKGRCTSKNKQSMALCNKLYSSGCPSQQVRSQHIDKA